MAVLERVENRAPAIPSGDLASHWLQLGKQFREQLADPVFFDRMVGQLAIRAQELGASAIGGVSRTGVRLAEASAVASGIPRWDGRGVRTLVLIDGLVNTGIQLAIAMREAERAGVERVVALAGRVDDTARANWLRAGVEIEAVG